MFTNLTINRAFATLFSVVIGFVLLFFTVPPHALIVALNGVFVGVMFSLSIAFFPLIRDILSGRDVYDRAQHMAFGIFTLIIAINVLVLNSVYFRSMGLDLPPSPVTALGRYLSICGMVMVVTAPDYNQPLFYGRDRRLLWASLIIGLITAVTIVTIQESDLCQTSTCIQLEQPQ